MNTPDNHKFVSEAIKPVDSSFDTSAMLSGAPGLPQKFTWRKKAYTVATVVKSWTSTGPCTHGSEEQYVRKHWYMIRTEDGAEMRIYFERKPRAGQNKKRWWLASISRDE